MDKTFVYTLGQASRADSFPHQPQLQTIHLAAALHRLISNVQIHIVEFVLLEEVCGVGAVALLQHVLGSSRGLSVYSVKDIMILILEPENETVKPDRGIL